MSEAEPEPGPVELVLLADEENSVTVRVPGRIEPGILAYNGNGGSWYGGPGRAR